MQRKVIAEMVNILASFIAACSYQFVIGAWRTKETGIGVVVKYWEIIADNLKKSGWSWGWISALDRDGRRITQATTNTSVQTFPRRTAQKPKTEHLLNRVHSDDRHFHGLTRPPNDLAVQRGRAAPFAASMG
jgi:hypothetical protein